MSASRARRMVGVFVAVVVLCAGLAVLAVPPAQPAEAQTLRTSLVWSATLTADTGSSGSFSVVGCSSFNSYNMARCKGTNQALDDPNFTYAGESRYVRHLHLITTGSLAGRLRIATDKDVAPNWHDDIRRLGVLTVDGRTFRFIDGTSTGQFVAWDNSGLTWTAGQTISVSIAVAPLTDDQARKYGWCFNRMSEAACIEAIKRWDGESDQITLTNPGKSHCPETHSIRTATGAGTVCEQTFHDPSYGNTQPLAEAWGVTGIIAPPSEPEDAWDGSARACNHNGRGYYNLPPNMPHGLGYGCHTHQTNGPFHEHKHVTGH